MRVADLVGLLQTLPQDAEVIPSSEPVSRDLKKGALRVGQAPATEGEFRLQGFTKEELLREEHDLIFLERENLALFAVVANSAGKNIVGDF